MTNENFVNIKSKYKEEKWIICLETFSHYSLVSITNECCHSFHRKWLYEWFLNADPTHPFKWPHWNTVNRRIFDTERSKSSGSKSHSEYSINIGNGFENDGSPIGPNLAMEYFVTAPGSHNPNMISMDNMV